MDVPLLVTIVQLAGNPVCCALGAIVTRGEGTLICALTLYVLMPVVGPVLLTVTCTNTLPPWVTCPPFCVSTLIDALDCPETCPKASTPNNNNIIILNNFIL